MKQTPKNKYYYDAKGAVVMTTLDNNRRMIQHLDGESKPVRQDQYGYNPSTYQYFLQQTEYFIYSSVLGKLLTEVTSGGTKKRTFVYGINGVVALQQYGGTNQEVRWEHTDPSKATYIQTGYNGTMYYLQSPAELDPLGSNVGMTNPYNQQPEQTTGPGGWGYGSWGDPFGSYTCMVDWMIQPCSMAAAHLAAGSGIIYNGPQFTPVTYNGQTTFAQYRAYGDGYAGYVPNNARYVSFGNVAPIGYKKNTPPALKPPPLIRDTNLAKLNGVTGNGESDLKYQYSNLIANGYSIDSLQRPFSDDEVELLRGLLEDYLKKRADCVKFIEEVLSRASTAANNAQLNLMEVFKRIASPEQGGFMWHFAAKSTQGGGQALGSLKDGNLAITISSRTYLNSAGMSGVKIPKDYINSQIKMRIETAIHELMHQSGSNGSFDDRALATATAAYLGIKRPDYEHLASITDRAFSYSLWWDTHLGRACK